MDPRTPENHAAEEYAFPGYILEESMKLRPNLNEKGNIANPDLILTPNSLCDVCQKIVLEAEAWCKNEVSNDYDETKQETLASTPFHDTETDIRHSMERGCCLCSLFLSTEKHWAAYVSGPQYKSPDIIPDALQSWVAFGRHASNSMYMRQVRRDKEVKGHVLIDFLLDPSRASKDDTIASENISANLSASNASSATFTLASSWLDECRSGHHKCQPSWTATYKPPKRLLDVGDTTSSRIRIIYSQGPTAYLTVSHCWGNVHSLQLDSRTYQALTGGFDDRDLPQLFRDCVNVTRRLGYQYLWIDSLCILQDSATDKKEEIHRMGEIYQGSVCNIAAVMASNSDASLFTKHLPLITEPTIRREFPESGGTFLVKELGVYMPELLYGRAWVMQERLLSPRTLEYTTLGIGWRCGEMSRGREENAVTGRFADFSKAWNWLLGLRSTDISEEEKYQGQKAWMEIVNQYTSTKLTFEEDRNVALLGVISVLQQRTHLSLSHGVCKDFFPYSLLWWVLQRLPGRPPYPVPSWSSTFRSQMSWQYFKREDTPGSVLKGDRLHYSELSVDERTSVLDLKTKYCGSRLIKSDSQRQDGSFDSLRVQNLDGEWTNMDVLNSSCKYTASVNFRMDYTNFPLTEVDLALLIQTPGQDNDEGCTYGLVLSKLPGEDGLWARIGLFRVHAYEDENDVLAHFQEEKSYRIR